ncbi:glycosyltransferase family 8 protein [Ceratobasidium sp. AG-Ba]|nr:glycosyltransferase family 8 protein [Ceratobasidium sp. AG-Ba]
MSPNRVPSNCGHTYAIPGTLGSDALCTPFQPGPNNPQVLHLIGAGLVVLIPNDDTHSELLRALHSDRNASKYIFVEQDFLANYFKGRIKYLGYEYNAVKPMRECHKDLWRDEGVRNVHYVLKDKPWSIPEGSGTLEAQFRVVHGWWWDEWRRLGSEFGGKSWWRLVALLAAQPLSSHPMITHKL